MPSPCRIGTIVSDHSPRLDCPPLRLFHDLGIAACIPRTPLVLVLCGFVASCNLDRNFNLPRDQVLTSLHFKYHARSTDSTICEELLGKLESDFQVFEGMFGLSWPLGRRIEYYKFVDSGDFSTNAPCPRGSGACFDAGDVYSYESFEQHELVHAYLWPFGRPPPVIAEGTAVAVACNRAIPETPTLSLADALLVTDPLEDLRVYETGGRLVRYLLSTYGPGLFMEFYVGLDRRASLVEMDAAMRAIFGAGVDEIWNATLMTYATCPQLFACSQAALPLDGSEIPVVQICGLDRDERTLTLYADSDVAIAGPIGTLLGSCDPIPFVEELATTNAMGTSQIGLLYLPAGRYHINFSTRLPTVLTAKVPMVSWAGAECDGLDPFIVGASEYPSLAITLPLGAPVWVTKLRFEGPHSLTIVRGSGPSETPLVLTMCPSCDFTSPLCQVVDLRTSGQDVIWDGEYILRFETGDANVSSRIDIRPQ
jgi:hypothetical protein